MNIILLLVAGFCSLQISRAQLLPQHYNAKIGQISSLDSTGVLSRPWHPRSPDNTSIDINPTSSEPPRATRKTEQISLNENIKTSTQPSKPRDVAKVFTLDIRPTFTNYTVGPTFLSVALGGSKLGTFCNLVRSPTAKNIAIALSPADIRIGGTISHQMTYDPRPAACSVSHGLQPYVKSLGPYPSLPQYSLSGPQMEALNTFLTDVDWGLLYNLNSFKFRADGYWDASNVESLLNYTSARGVRIAGFALGNEPNGYRHKYSYILDPKILTENYRILKRLLLKYPIYANSKLYGPDVTDVKKVTNSRNILRGFLASGADNIVDGISLHHYYCNARSATVATFLDVASMDAFKGTLEVAHRVIKENSSRPVSIHLTETSSCYGGGATGLSDRYVAGFLWLDKLGVSAMYGVSRVFRQAFWGGSYGIVNYGVDVPLPDYYLSVLHKKLVRGPVLSVTMTPSDSKLRVYANCARNLWYSPGAVVVYYLNVDKSSKTVSLPLAKGGRLEVYILSPGDGKSLNSSNVRLNGEVLKSSASGVFPKVSPAYTRGNIELPAQTFGFIVMPSANEATCINYFSDHVNDTSNLPPITLRSEFNSQHNNGGESYSYPSSWLIFVICWCAFSLAPRLHE